MGKPALYSRRPILTAPLRWRVKFAGLCLVLGVLGRWAPAEVTIGPALFVVVAVLAVTLYPLFDGADPGLLKSNRPRLQKMIGILCLIGFLATFVTRVVTGDFSSHDGFHFFLMGGLLSGSPLALYPRMAKSRTPPRKE